MRHGVRLFLMHLTSLRGRERGLCPAAGLVLDGRREQLPEPVIQLLGQGWVGMHWEPDILSDTVGEL